MVDCRKRRSVDLLLHGSQKCNTIHIPRQKKGGWFFLSGSAKPPTQHHCPRKRRIEKDEINFFRFTPGNRPRGGSAVHQNRKPTLGIQLNIGMVGVYIPMQIQVHFSLVLPQRSLSNSLHPNHISFHFNHINH